MVCRTTDIDMQILNDENGEFKKAILKINGIEISSTDFIEMRDIIFAQGGVEYDDRFLHEDAEVAIIEGKEMEARDSGYIAPTYENLIDKLAVLLHMSVGEMKDKYTIRKFNNALKERGMFENWRITTQANVSGFVKFEKPIAHWTSGHEEPDIMKGENIDFKQSNMYKMISPI
jgi:hypothetical protein